MIGTFARKSLYLALTLLACATHATEWTYKNDVLILDESNYNKAIEDFDFILVEIYAPWW